MSSIEQPGGGPNPSKRIKKSYSVDQQRNVDADNFNGGNNDNDELLQLQWNNHSNAFGAALANLRVSETFCDVTLISANGENYSAHRVVISACSSHLETMLKPLPRWQHPVLLMPSNVPNKDLRDILAFMYSGEVHVERGRLTSFLKSAELLKVHGLCDQIDSAEQVTSNVASNTEQPKKTIIKKSKRNSKPVTATISPAFAPLKNRNSPIPSTSSNQRISSSPGISVKMEEPNFSDEENRPEHVVIPTDPNSMGAESFAHRPPDDDDDIADNSCNTTNNDTGQQQPKLAQISTTTNTSGGHQNSNKGGPADNLVVLFSESARCHFCNVLCPDRATLKAHLEDTHQPPRHALCENCENFFHICAITRHKSKCMERYQQQSDTVMTSNNA